WLPLPASADLLGLCRRSDRALRALGWRLDDARAALPLSSVGDVWARPCARIAAARIALVSALALRFLAAGQYRSVAGRRRGGSHEQLNQSLPRCACAEVEGAFAWATGIAPAAIAGSNKFSIVTTRMRRSSSAESACMGSHGGTRSAASNNSIPPPISTV